MSDQKQRAIATENAAPPSGDGASPPCADPVVVVGDFVVVDGCKVARVEPGGVLAFPDKCRRRVSQRGTNQVRVKAADLVAVIEASEK